MFKRLYFIVCLLMLSFVTLNAQTSNQLIRKGNKNFSSKNYAQAEVFYRKAIEKEPNNAIGNYNLARCLQAQHKNAEAKKIYEKAAKLETDPIRQASSYNNLGTIYQGEKNYSKAIDYYKKAMRDNPSHNNARYNFELCQRQQNKQNNKKNSGGSKNNQNKNKQNKNQSNKDNKQKKKDNSQQKPQNNNNGMSKSNAEQLLNAAMQQEKETQKRLAKAMQQPSDKKLDKNW